MRNRFRIYFTPKAEDDLERIYEFSFMNWAIEHAEIYHDNLYHTINQLEHYPDIGRVYHREDMIYRTLVVRQHIIYYKLREGKIFIVRILHGSMDRDRWMD